MEEYLYDEHLTCSTNVVKPAPATTASSFVAPFAIATTLTRNHSLSIRTALDRFALATPIVAASGTFYEDETLLLELSDGIHTGRGETVGMVHLGETVSDIEIQVQALRDELQRGLTRDALQQRLPAGSARAVIDAALWDLEAKQRGIRVDKLTGLKRAFEHAVHSLLTLSPETPTQLAQQLQPLPANARIKLKLNGQDDESRLECIRYYCPHATLIVDANEALTPARLIELMPALRTARVALIEQPLAANADDALRDIEHDIPFVADEACSDAASLERLVGLYDFVNIKLEKCGGLTHALQMIARARELGLRLMVGCFGGTSLAIAPAFVVASACEYADLDAPMLLRTDRLGAPRCAHGWLAPPHANFWG